MRRFMAWSTPKARLAGGVARAFLAAGAWTEEELVARGTMALGEEVRWVRALARATLKRYAAREDVQLRELARLLQRIRGLSRASLWKRPVQIRRWLVPVVGMRKPRWAVPSITTAGDLAAFFGIDPSELTWLADPRGLERLARSEPLAHYRYAWVKKKTGGHRLLEAPKPRTRELQRRILHELLDHVPPHPAAHGFRRGCSVLTHATPHAGRALVLRLDLEDFFPSIGAARVRALFGALGYPEDVAHLLACLCTNVAPVGRMVRPALPPYASHADVRARHDAETRARTRHLPQGAPTSPAIANLCAFRLDVRLATLAARMNASYTRYADDLVFSGDAEFQRRSAHFAALAAGIASEEGFTVNHRKTRFTSQAASQRVGGLVVNARPRAPRAEYDALRALLHNASRTGLEAQNHDGHQDFRRHVEGRVAWLSTGDASRARKLQTLLEALPRD